MVRHRMHYEVRCSGCRKTSTLYVSEDAGPPFEETPRVTLTCEGFRCEPGPPIALWCGHCGKPGRRI